MKYSALLVGLLVCASAPGPAQDMDELELDHNVKSSFVTPHTAWAKPYAQGTTRVLFFVNGRGANAREVCELMQRFDLEAEMVYWARVVDTTRDEWHGAEKGIRRMARLLTRKWDAFVFIGVEPTNMPVEQQLPLFQAVTEGTGLVLVGPDDKRVLKDKNKLKELPEFVADCDGAAAFTVVKGRGIRLPKAPDIAYGPGWETVYDQWDMRLGKAVLWAAGKEPKTELKVTGPAAELARTALPPKIALAWRGAAGKTVAEAALRRDDGAVMATSKHPLDKAEGTTAVELPAVRAGRYWLDVIARDGGKVAGFTSLPLTVGSERKVDEVTLDQDWSEVGGRFTGRATLSGPAGGNENVVVSLRDRRDREIARRTIKPAVNQAAFSFDVPAWFPMLVTVRATLTDGGREIASAWRFARVVKRHRGQFNFIMWDIPAGNLGPYGIESLARNGVTVHLSGTTPPERVAAYDLAWIAYSIHLGGQKDDQGIMKPACWHDEAGVQAFVDGVVEKCLPTRQHGAFLYSLGDEIVVRGSCLSPHCLDAYRAYLKEQYGDIAALNASWGTTFTGFDQVQLSKPDDNDENEAKRTGNFPRWFDRQAFQSYSFGKLCERFGRAFRALDPRSRCGFEGAGTFRSADDLDLFVRSNTFWSPYPGTADEVLRSIAPRDFPRSNWMGYTKDADSLLQKYWRMVTRGCDSVWWWRWEVIGRFHGWLAPNFDPYPANREILNDTRIVRDGLGDLLLHSEMQTDGIGIVYSQPSAYAAQIAGSPTFGSYEGNHTAFHGAVRELGCNFRYFTDRQLRLGEVDLSRFKVVLLPQTQAMSAGEAELYRQYVRQGGVLIADVRPAVFDGHVKPLAAGQLDDVFGIKRTGTGEAQLADGVVEELALKQARVDPGVAPTTAKPAGAAGAVPLWLTNRFGQGTAVLLNLAMATYPSLSAADTAELAAERLSKLLDQAGVKPGLARVDSKGQRLRNLEVTRWVNGPVQIVSLFRHQGTAESVKVSLPKAGYVYDLKNHRDLGRQQSFQVTLTPYRAMFYALSPEPLKPATLKAAPSVARGGVQRVQLASTVPRGNQAVKVEVKLPGGANADWIDPVTVVDGKGAAVDVPVAFNDPTGKWTVQATELYTGKTVTAPFEVK